MTLSCTAPNNEFAEVQILDAMGLDANGMPIYFGTENVNLPLPVEMTTFDYVLQNSTVLLKWSVVSEFQNLGFVVQRQDQETTSWQDIATIPGRGTTTQAGNFEYIDHDLPAGRFLYRLKQIDLNGQINYSKELTLVIQSPQHFSLEPNYPNPFNPATTLRYQLAHDCRISLDIYNAFGQHIKTLVKADQTAGPHRIIWDGVNEQGAPVSPGIYIARLRQDGAVVSSRKMILAQ